MSEPELDYGPYSSKLHLPEYVRNNKIGDASWGCMTGNEIQEVVDKAYEEIVKWRKNLFKLPTGKSGKEFIHEVSKTIDMFNSAGNMES